MEMYERIRILRKDFLKMSQEVFGERLGVSRSVIKNIELDALARPEQKLSLIKLMCKEFGVNEEWLLNGTEPMYATSEAEYSTLIDRVMTGENDFAKNIFKTFASFEKEDWEALQRMISTYASVATANDGFPDTPEELEETHPPIELGEQDEVG